MSTGPVNALRRSISSMNLAKSLDIPWEKMEPLPNPYLLTQLVIYWSYGVMATVMYLSELFEWLYHIYEPRKVDPEQQPPGYAPLFDDFSYFYTRRFFGPIRDCWERPISSGPGAWIDVMDRRGMDGNRYFEYSGKSTRCLNLGSYNYLGFGSETHGYCSDSVVAAIQKHGTSTAGFRSELGNHALIDEVEAQVARFVGKEAALVHGMGFATNSTTLPVLAGKGTLIISDSLNHTSIVVGCRSSGAKIKVFKHNDPQSLERLVRKSIVEGQPRTHRPWKKILIVVEGIYSMEGEILLLPAIVAVAKKFKCYLYVDEAHSIGALGRTGRGVCEHTGVDPADIDVLMGTFTKSFGSIGGYIAGDRALIDEIRRRAFSPMYDTSLSVPSAQQISAALRIISGEDGTTEGQRRIQQLHDNSNYFRRRMLGLGFMVLGDFDSPIMPVLLLHAAKIAAFGRECLAHNMAVVVVGYPATSLTHSRARFCISAAHSRQDIDWAIAQLEEVGNTLMMHYLRSPIF